MARRTSQGFVVRPLAGALALAGVIAGSTPAQDGTSSIAGSASATSLAAAVTGGGGATTDSARTIQAEISAPAAGASMESANYRLLASIAWIEPSLRTNLPLVFGIEPPTGPAAGCKSVVVRGLNFSKLGAGSAIVRFDGVPAPAVQVTSDTTIEVVTPAGLDSLANSIGLADVRVENALGSGAALDAYAYLPALELDSPAQPGKSAGISLRAEAGALLFLVLGHASPGVAVKVPPFRGKLAITVDPAVVLDGVPLPSGALALALPLPDEPGLVGFTLDLQALAVTATSPLGGGFSRVLSMTVQP